MYLLVRTLHVIAPFPRLLQTPAPLSLPSASCRRPPSRCPPSFAGQGRPARQLGGGQLWDLLQGRRVRSGGGGLVGGGRGGQVVHVLGRAALPRCVLRILVPTDSR